MTIRFGLFGTILHFFPQNLSNQYVLDLWLIFQKPIRFGIEKLKGKKENEIKMQFKILIKTPLRVFNRPGVAGAVL